MSLRVYGRDSKTGKWIMVQTQDDGSNGYVYVTNLIQCLKLVLNESPFYSNYGIPAQTAIIQQIFPDYYVTQTQNQFSQFFTSLIVAKVPNTDPVNPVPIYNINAVMPNGTKYIAQVAT